MIRCSRHGSHLKFTGGRVRHSYLLQGPSVSQAPPQSPVRDTVFLRQQANRAASLQSGECLFDRPPPLKSMMKVFMVNPQFHSPRLNVLRSPVKRDHAGVSTVLGLLFFRRPLAITGAVVPIIINALNRVFLGWSFTHVIQKILKLLPACAHSNSAPTVALKTNTLRVLATLFHSDPDFIERSSAPSVSRRSGDVLLRLKASTRKGFPPEKGCRSHRFYYTTRTQTLPMDKTSPLERLTNNGETAKLTTGQIFKVMSPCRHLNFIPRPYRREQSNNKTIKGWAYESCA